MIVPQSELAKTIHNVHIPKEVANKRCFILEFYFSQADQHSDLGFRLLRAGKTYEIPLPH